MKDYWRMVWQEKAQIIVCLTSLKEKGACKAELFFPTSTETPLRAGPLRLILMGVKKFGSRRITVLHLKIYCWFGKSGQERDLSMVFYGEWPDRAVSTYSCLLGSGPPLKLGRLDAEGSQNLTLFLFRCRVTPACSWTCWER